jgi:hypothetical protein
MAFVLFNSAFPYDWNLTFLDLKPKTYLLGGNLMTPVNAFQHSTTQPFIRPFQGPSVLLRLKNSCDNLTHFAIFDYVRWNQFKNNEQSLLSLDTRYGSMKKVNDVFSSTQSNLYLIRAHFNRTHDANRINRRMIIHVLDTSVALNLSIVLKDGMPHFENDASFRKLSPQQADEIMADEIMRDLF